MTTFSRTFFPASLAVGALVLGGCTTANPRASLPAVQKQLGERSGSQVAWPMTDDERRQTDASVKAWLDADLTVESAVSIALFNNHSLRATFEEIGVSQAELAAASRLPNPTLSASVRWPSNSPRGPNSEFGLAFSLLDSVLLPLRKRLAEQQFTTVQNRVTHEALGLVAEVKTAFYAALAAQDFRIRLETIANINAAAADLAQRQFDAGNINQLEREQWVVVAQQTQLDLKRADAEIRVAREKVNRLLGLRTAQTNWKLTGSLPALPPQESALGTLEETALEQRLDLQAARTDVALSQKALDLKRKTRLLPFGVNVGVDTERESDGNRLTGPNLEIGLPIFDQGQGEVARLSANWRMNQERLAALESDVRSEVRAASDALQTARETVEFYQQTLLPQRKLIVRQTLLHYNAMQKSTYELLAAKEQQQTAEHASIEALRDYWFARTELEHAIGGRLPLVAVSAATEMPAATPEPVENEHANHNR
jgi:outer membrane protein, heavy metal efflux system